MFFSNSKKDREKFKLAANDSKCMEGDTSQRRLLEYHWIGVGLLYILGLQIMGEKWQ